MRHATAHIVLLTDFGTADGYAGVLHGVLAQRCPAARVIDLSHHVPRHNVAAAAFMLWAAYRYFPAHTVFLGVVDPGVGTARALLAVATRRGPSFVAPDNGLLKYVLAELPDARGVVIDHAALGVPQPSQTFHGRDVLAPAAAALACGVPLTRLGRPCDLTGRAIAPTCAPPAPGRRWHAAQILHVDHFGNLITDVPLAYDVQRFRCRRHMINMRVNAYAEAPRGTLCFLPGSAGRWEIAVREASASERLHAAAGETIAFTLCSNVPA